jgi:hypothetical protein
MSHSLGASLHAKLGDSVHTPGFFAPEAFNRIEVSDLTRKAGLQVRGIKVSDAGNPRLSSLERFPRLRYVVAHRRDCPPA